RAVPPRRVERHGRLPRAELRDRLARCARSGDDVMTALRHTMPGITQSSVDSIEKFTPRYLAYRLHHRRPGGGQAFTEWCIETQLTLAFDVDEADGYAVLAAFRPDLEGQVIQHIETLLELADEA